MIQLKENRYLNNSVGFVKLGCSHGGESPVSGFGRMDVAVMCLPAEGSLSLSL